MSRSILCLASLAIMAAGCGDDSSAPVGGSGGTGGSGGSASPLEWPPEATVYFDDRNILNADCATDEDCAMVLGYYHASERFGQMDTIRRFSTGRLADILVKPIAELFVQDFGRIRALFSTRDGRPLEERAIEEASPKTLALFEAYSAGVNQWLAELRAGDPNAIFPREFTHPLLDYSPEDVPDWTPQDSIASVVALIDTLTNEEAKEVAAGLARAEIGDDAKFADLWQARPLVESSILPPGWMPPSASAAIHAKAFPAGGRGRSVTVPWREEVLLAPLFDRAEARRRLNAIPALRRLAERLSGVEELRQAFGGTGFVRGSEGSNNWVIAGSRTTSGNPCSPTTPTSH